MALKIVKFNVNHALLEVESDEASIGKRKTRRATRRELELYLLAIVREN
ncbi:MAG TPA: hypothetical protein VMA36_03880 [Candidatus Limnocylindria bacterium]|jgi:hypothetical protein|nr:hypothetical protein [Candidatus Limnocylindria bacterium]